MPVKKGSTATDSLEHYIKLSYDSKFSQERQRVFSNKAYKIGMESGNDSLLYKGLYTKIEHDLAYNSDSSRYYLSKLKKLALNTKKQAALGGYYYLYASYFSPINIDSSFSYYDRSKTEYLKANDSMRAGYSLLMMTDLQRISSDYYGAETTATAALACLKNSGEESYLVAVYNYLGMSYKQLFNYENALKYYSKAYEITKDSLSKDAVMNNIALIYMDQKEYAKAIKILRVWFSKKGQIQTSNSKPKLWTIWGILIFSQETKEAMNICYSHCG